MQQWTKHCDHFLAEIICHEGRGDCMSQNICPICCEGLESNFRCIDCHGGQFICAVCICSAHTFTPLH